MPFSLWKRASTAIAKVVWPNMAANLAPTTRFEVRKGNDDAGRHGPMRLCVERRLGQTIPCTCNNPHALENPFKGPFACPRSGSLDLWSSYSHQSAAISTPPFDKYDTSGFGGVSITTQALELHDETLSSPTVESHAYNVQATPSDLLDSANLPADDEAEFSTKPTTSPRYAAFR